MKSLIAIPLVLAGVTIETGRDPLADARPDTESSQKAKYSLNAGPKCAEGYVPITTTWNDCAAAARVLGFEGDSVAFVQYNKPWGTKRPQGCFRKGNGEFHFNDGPGGNSRAKDKILCILEAKAPPVQLDARSSSEIQRESMTGNSRAEKLEVKGTRPEGTIRRNLRPPSADIHSVSNWTDTVQDGWQSGAPSGDRESGEPWSGASPDSTCHPDNRTRVDHTTRAPWNQIVKLRITFPRETGSCTGFFISERVVMTNAHCLYNQNYGGWTTNVLVCPGAPGNFEPYGCQYAKTVWAKYQYFSDDDDSINYDYAALFLPDDTFWEKGIGYFGYRTEGNEGLVNVAGWPGEIDHGLSLQFSAGPYAVDPRESDPAWYYYNAYSGVGMSGGPMWAYYPDSGTRRVIGIITRGDPCPRQTRRGLKVNEEMHKWMTYMRDNQDTI